MQTKVPESTHSPFRTTGFNLHPWKAIPSICLLAAASTVLGNARAKTPNALIILGHDYVNYTTQHVPCTQGTLEDVTNSLTEHDGHTYDLYGNILVINTTNNTIKDATNQTVGFVDSSSPP